MADDGQETRETIEHYFHRGYKYDEIVLFLGKYHGIKMCTRTLKRRLRDYGLKKSGNDGEVNDGHVIATIQEIMNEAGSLSGLPNGLARLTQTLRYSYFSSKGGENY